LQILQTITLLFHRHLPFLFNPLVEDIFLLRYIGRHHNLIVSYLCPDLISANIIIFNLVHSYGQLTPEDVSAFVATFIGQGTRQAQNDVQFYYCIANTLGERGHPRNISEAKSCTMEGMHSGIMLLKLLMRK
jgi:hypothetical protein